MPVRLGISPIGWSNDDLPELGGDIPLETCLAEAREAGFATSQKPQDYHVEVR
jgi:inosose dehydratase